MPGSSSSNANTFIAPFCDDLSPSAGGAVYIEDRGTAPSRRLIIQWHQVPHFSNTGAASFQVILYYGRNDIIIQYLDVQFGNSSYDNGASATVGIQLNQNDAEQYSCNAASLDDGLALLFSYSNYGESEAKDMPWIPLLLLDD